MRELIIDDLLRTYIRNGFAACLIFFSCAIGSTNGTLAADFSVSSAADIQSILSSVGPGDTITMQNGTWTDQEINFSGAGTASQPITLRAETPGQVILNGSSSLNISGDWLVADGLNFEGGALGASDHVVEFRGDLGHATNSRLTNSAITNYNPPDINTRYFWVSMYGNNNRVDHNTFDGQNHSGVTVTVWRGSNDADHHQIDNNLFLNRPEGNGNGFETIRIGTSANSLSSSHTVVENNVFQNVNGEAEIISNKAGENTFRYNTFRGSAGTLTLRHGDNNLVAGNFFLGENKNETGGVRVIGEGQQVVNNYFANLDGRAGGAISISAGVPGSAVNQYFQVKGAVIAHNTIVNVQEAAITFDDGLGSSSRTLLAENVTVANNLIRSSADPLFEGSEGAGWHWEGNIAFGQSLGPAVGNTGITVVDPQLTLGGDGLWRPDASSPAIDGASGDYSSIASFDMDGQARIGLFDIGADEFSTASIVRRPLVAGDVGYDWDNIIEPPPTGPVCVANGLAIQSDNYAGLLDPNGDGDVWTLAAATDALGGTTMVAPAGSRTNLPGDHDALLLYDLEFAETGTYTAYYRARGSDGSSDSIFTPDDFGVDPDNTETLANDGIYRWEVGGEFEIGLSDVGVPLEFRIGRRERNADFDAFVLHLDSNLTSTELDALFQMSCEVDFDHDGFVDCADISALTSEIAAQTNSEMFDLDGDGLVNQNDLSVWLADAGEISLGAGNAFLPGDANLDGLVDELDFDVWNANRFTTTSSWCAGDFNADGFVDVSDWSIWNVHRGMSSAAAAVAVPEPCSWLMSVSLAMMLLLRLRRIR